MLLLGSGIVSRDPDSRPCTEDLHFAGSNVGDLAKLLESVEASLVVCDVEKIGCFFVFHSFAQGHGGIRGPDEDWDAAGHEDLAGAP